MHSSTESLIRKMNRIYADIIMYVVCVILGIVLVAIQVL